MDAISFTNGLHMIHCSESYRLKKMAKLCRGHDVLDIGFAQYPNKFIEAENLVGLDLEHSIPSENYKEVRIGDALQLPNPFEADSFDTVIAGELLEHVENPLELLRAIHKTLRPGGQLILSTPNPLSPPELICNIFLNKSILYTREHITLYPQRWLLRMLDMAGFTSLRLLSGGLQFPFIGDGPFPAVGLIPWPRAFCYQTIAVAERQTKAG